jgi:putative transposase
VYNFYLSERNEVYKNTGKTLTFTDFNNAINQLKKHPYFDWLKEVDKFSLSNAILNVDTAFKNFFEGNARFPRFKSKRKSKQSYTTNMTNANIKVDFDRKVIQLPKVGEVSFRCGKKVKAIKGTIKSATITRHSSGLYTVSIVTEEQIQKEDVQIFDLSKVKTEDILALDMGLTHFAITSTGQKIDNPRYYQENLVKLASLQRKLKNKKKGSSNGNKLQAKISKLHLHIANMRKDFLHKVSFELVDKNHVIVIEDLHVKGMLRNRKLAKSIQDVGWGMFKTLLSYKCERKEKRLVLIDRFFPSTKQCNGCKEKNPLLSLSDRVWVCPSCGCEHDRDLNAAINILEEGMALLYA